MPIENTDLERRVLAHEQILQMLMAQLAEREPNFLDGLKQRFASARRGAYEHDHIETADHAEAFLREVARLVRVRRAAPSLQGVAQCQQPQDPQPAARKIADSVIVRYARTNGVWHVTRDDQFVGDYLSEAPARAAACEVARIVERAGGRAEIRAGLDRPR